MLRGLVKELREDRGPDRWPQDEVPDDPAEVPSFIMYMASGLIYTGVDGYLLFPDQDREEVFNQLESIMDQFVLGATVRRFIAEYVTPGWSPSTESYSLPKILGREEDEDLDESIFTELISVGGGSKTKVANKISIVARNAELSNFAKLHGGTGSGQGTTSTSEDQALLRRGMFKENEKNKPQRNKVAFVDWLPGSRQVKGSKGQTIQKQVRDVFANLQRESFLGTDPKFRPQVGWYVPRKDSR